MLRVLSLGAGVQSTTLALMAAAGEIGPMPDCAIFADTGWEPRAVYEHLGRLEPQLPFPVYRVSAGNIRTAIMAGARGARLANPPYFTLAGDLSQGFLRRSCTSEFKIAPIIAKVRELAGVVPRSRGPRAPIVEQWIGISTDEASRMKPSGYRWIQHRWPLIEMGMSRWDCLRWSEKRCLPKPPKSSCIGCPFHSDNEWRDMRDNRPEEWADAVEMDKAIRGGVRGTTSTLFSHRDRLPLDEVDLSTAEDHGQLNLFNNECEGLCGV